MENGLEVIDFKEEDELPEIVSSKYLDKSKNPNLQDAAMLKYEFVENVAHDASIPRKEANNVPSVDVEVTDCDHSCDEVVQSQPLRTSSYGFTLKEDDSELEGCPRMKSTSCELEANNELDIFEPRTSILELRLRDSGAEAPSPRSQSNCLPCHSQSSDETLNVFSSATRSLTDCSPSSPTSDIAEGNGCLTGNAADHCSGEMVLDDTHRTIAIAPDYILYQKNYWTGLVIFSSDGIKFKGSTAQGSQEIFSFEREIDDIIDIKCEWVQKTSHVMIKVDVLSKDVKEVEDANGASGIEELKLMVFEPEWSEKQEAITSLNEKYLAIWEFKHDYLSGDQDDLLVQTDKPYFPKFDEHFEEVIYPKGDSDAVSLGKRDVDLLQPETFVNDTIIDFYIKYLKNQIQVEERRRFHFFNSFFFRKLADLDKDPSCISDGRAAFLRVHKWTRKVDMFGKDYIFIPVNFNLHWSLIVICHPGEVAAFKDEDLDKSLKVPCILHMDSLRGSHAGLKNLVQRYLWEEWKERNKESSEDLCSKFMNLRFVSLELPQQENLYDCGLFLLHYLELFLTEAPANFSPFKITQFSNFLNADWFVPTEASLKRTFIQKLIFKLLETRSREITLTDCIDNHQSSEIPEIDETGVGLLAGSCSPEVACHGNSPNSRYTQGIEISLLASSSMRSMQNVDSGLGLRELFEQGVTAGSLLGHFQSFDEPSYYNPTSSVSPGEEEDAETSERFVFFASGETSYQQLTGITSQSCAIPYSSGGFMLPDGSWNPGISMQGEHDIETSPEGTSASDDDANIGIIENYGTGANRDISENERRNAQGDVSEMKTFVAASGEVLEGTASAASEKPNKKQFGNLDDGLNPTKEHRIDDTQMTGDDLLTESVEPAAKRIRLNPEEELLDTTLNHESPLVAVDTATCDDTHMTSDDLWTESVEPAAKRTRPTLQPRDEKALETPEV